MRRLYLIVPNTELTNEVVQELRSDGVGEDHMRLFAHRPKRLGAAVAPVSELAANGNGRKTRALAGAVLALAVALLIIAVAGAGPWAGIFLLVATLGGAAVGASGSWGRAYPEEPTPLRDRLKRDDVVMMVDVADERLGSLEDAIKSRHPEIRVQGTDPAGSPPFPLALR